MFLSFFFLFFLLLSPSPQPVFANTPLPFDHSEWDRFLKEFVNEKGEVNYRAAKEKPELLQKYLSRLKTIPEDEFNQWPREERAALILNAYNAGVIQAILLHYPVKNPMAISGIWDEQSVLITTLASGDKARAYSLNEIQRDLLLKQFRDEKILFALCNGSRSSPPLQKEAFTGPRLEGQLYLVTRQFVNDEKKNQIDLTHKKVVLSRIFQWYGRDFILNWRDYPEDERWGPDRKAVLSFLAHYLEDSKKVEFLKEGEYKVKYQSFDWRLNDWA